MSSPDYRPSTRLSGQYLDPEAPCPETTGGMTDANERGTGEAALPAPTRDQPDDDVSKRDIQASSRQLNFTD